MNIWTSISSKSAHNAVSAATVLRKGYATGDLVYPPQAVGHGSLPCHIF